MIPMKAWAPFNVGRLTEAKTINDALLRDHDDPYEPMCSVPERRSVVVVNQREDLLGRVNATHDVVAK